MAYTADRAFELISEAHQRGRLAHAFLISGAPGSGKENLAARMIQLVNDSGGAGGGFDLFGEPVKVETPPLDELEGGHVRVIRPRMKSRRVGVEEIRDLEQTLHLAVGKGSCKVGVIVEADRMNDQAANAFLKTLEEPPKSTLLLLLTANPQRLLPTILSRCVRLPLLGGRPLLENGGAELVASLNRAAGRGFGTPVAALHLKAAFTSFLAQYRSEADDAAKAAEKEESAAYRDATDGLRKLPTAHARSDTTFYYRITERRSGHIGGGNRSVTIDRKSHRDLTGKACVFLKLLFVTRTNLAQVFRNRGLNH
ncbi:MAG: hypothetical protein EOP87_19025 [Verrucomicrobiaceae bacterium]|nr:MAG: hypothetical protein EOP87_19025 [Verrucomicrobiaceae bacterium]